MKTLFFSLEGAESSLFNLLGDEHETPQIGSKVSYYFRPSDPHLWNSEALAEGNAAVGIYKVLDVLTDISKTSLDQPRVMIFVTVEKVKSLSAEHLRELKKQQQAN